ncbi:hypothetical protein NE476_31170, partial [Enterocloster bolteae]|nr:hypothetical protein [Enterocloster bolteae]
MTIAGVATYFVFLNLSVEFEYLFAEGGLSVDRILGKAKRKKIFDCEKDRQFLLGDMVPGQQYIQ